LISTHVLDKAVNPAVIMIDPEDRFWIEGIGHMYTQWTTNIVDWDQRRFYTVVGHTSVFEENEDLAIDVLKRNIDRIDP
jgi:hypothetical protein